eukprot:s2417_g16.t1
MALDASSRALISPYVKDTLMCLVGRRDNGSFECWELARTIALEIAGQVLPNGGVVVTIRHPLTKAGTGPLEPVEDLWLPMSWGEARVYLAQKRRHQAKQWCLNLDEMD